MNKKVFCVGMQETVKRSIDFAERGETIIITIKDQSSSRKLQENIVKSCKDRNINYKANLSEGTVYFNSGRIFIRNWRRSDVLGFEAHKAFIYIEGFDDIENTLLAVCRL